MDGLKIEKIEVEDKSAARETFMLRITKAIEHLEMNRLPAFAKEFCEAISNYATPEIYANMDIELISELKKFDDAFSIEQRAKLPKETVSILKVLSQESTDAPEWFIEYSKLIFSSHPTAKDPNRINKIREMQELGNSLEINFILAVSLIQEGIRNDDENCFIESESIFNSFESIFEAREELPKRYRIHFPKDARQTLAIFRLWGVQNYSVFCKPSKSHGAAILRSER